MENSLEKVHRLISKLDTSYPRRFLNESVDNNDDLETQDNVNSNLFYSPDDIMGNRGGAMLASSDAKYTVQKLVPKNGNALNGSDFAEITRQIESNPSVNVIYRAEAPYVGERYVNAGGVNFIVNPFNTGSYLSYDRASKRWFIVDDSVVDSALNRGLPGKNGDEYQRDAVAGEFADKNYDTDTLNQPYRDSTCFNTFLGIINDESINFGGRGKGVTFKSSFEWQDIPTTFNSGAIKKGEQSNAVTNADAGRKFTLRDALLIFEKLTTNADAEQRKAMPNGLKTHIEQAINLFKGNDCGKLRSMYYAGFQESAKSDYRPRAYNSAIKEFMAENGINFEHYNFNFVERHISGIASPVLDDILLGTYQYKEGIAASYISSILRKIGVTNDSDKLSATLNMLGMNDADTESSSKAARNVSLSVCDIISYLLSRYLRVKLNSLTGSLRLESDVARNQHIFDSMSEALDTFYSILDNELFGDVTLMQLMDENYTLQDWFESQKWKKMQTNDNWLSRVNGLQKTFKKYNIDVDLALAENSNGEYFATNIPLCEFIMAMTGKKKEGSMLEKKTLKALSALPELTFHRELNRAGLEEAVSDDVKNMVNGIKGSLGEKSLDMYCTDIGVIIEAQGLFHFMAAALNKVDKDDRDEYISDIESRINGGENREALMETATDLLVFGERANVKNILFDDLTAMALNKMTKDGILERNGGAYVFSKNHPMAKQNRHLGLKWFLVEVVSKMILNGGNKNVDPFQNKTAFSDILLADYSSVYLQQINDKSKCKIVSDFDFKNGLKWEYIYVIERKINGNVMMEALSVPFVGEFSKFANEQYIKVVGNRAEERQNFATPLLSNTFWEGSELKKMQCLADQGVTLLKKLKTREMQVRGKK